ncbi:MAG: polysaccharide deacetylase family protein [Devosia sp.]
MYHYVRDLRRSPYPAIKGLELDRFRAQVRFLRENYTPVSMASVARAARGKESLPERAVLLTFDDGYAEHYENCFPILRDEGISGAFFAPVAPVRDRVLLDVNRVHFVLSVRDAGEIATEIDRLVDANRHLFDLLPIADYRSKWAHPTRFDHSNTIYVKRMLQVALPEPLRNKIAKELFARFVGVDEDVFADELYCSVDQLRLMQNSGMYVGSHGCTHVWLDAVDEDQQACEIEGSLSFLRSIGSPVDDYWAIAYPYGAWNSSLLNVLRRNRCTLGFTTEPAIADLGARDALRLPRMDTNDIPIN